MRFIIANMKKPKQPLKFFPAFGRNYEKKKRSYFQCSKLSFKL